MATVKTKRVRAAGGTDVHYPESDGKPMAETDLHWLETVELTWILKARYAAASDVYVASDLLIYYEEGNPRAAVAPDVFVVFGVSIGLRRVYKLWVEGPPPAATIELTSRKTRREDLVTKKAQYALLGVAEYFLYDPEAGYLRPPLQGYRLMDDTYQPIAPDSGGGLVSEQLGLRLCLEDGLLAVYDIATGLRLPRAAEREAALEEAVAELAIAKADAEAEIARLRAQLDRAQESGRSEG